MNPTLTGDIDLTALVFKRGNTRPWGDRVVQSWSFRADYPALPVAELGAVLSAFFAWMADNYGEPGALNDRPAWVYRLRSYWSVLDVGGIDIFFTEQADAARFALFFQSDR